ncbi:hypothetical protein N7526_007573 [Penicillium atrosanguineum]|nr:hypothetical protein N7526_007573 [Penicillium atrosanguineum]
MAYPQKAGKTTPRLAEDIRLYDPAHPPGTGRNLLSEVPPVFQGRLDGRQDWISSEACQHKYLIKADQTFLAQEEQKKKTRCIIQSICHLLEVPLPSTGSGQPYQWWKFIRTEAQGGPHSSPCVQVRKTTWHIIRRGDRAGAGG